MHFKTCSPGWSTLQFPLPSFLSCCSIFSRIPLPGHSSDQAWVSKWPYVFVPCSCDGWSAGTERLALHLCYVSIPWCLSLLLGLRLSCGQTADFIIRLCISSCLMVHLSDSRYACASDSWLKPFCSQNPCQTFVFASCVLVPERSFHADWVTQLYCFDIPDDFLVDSGGFWSWDLPHD